MKVKIGTQIIDSTEWAIMLILSKEDKENIANMAPDATKYCSYPEYMDPKEIEKWMKET